MKGRVLGKSTNKYETWVVDSGTAVLIIQINFAERKAIEWRPLNPDELNYSGVTGTELQHLKESPRDPSLSVLGGK